MKVLNAKVNWANQWDNDASLQLLVDKMPAHSDLRYEQRGSLYYAELDGYVSFFSWSKPGEGYGGDVFYLTMKDGTKKELKGPWSSRAGCMNDAGFGPCMDVSMTDDPEAFERGYTFYGAHATYEICIKAANEFLPEVLLIWMDKHNEMVFTPVLADGRKKPDPQTHWGKKENKWKIQVSPRKKSYSMPDASGEQFNAITR